MLLHQFSNEAGTPVVRAMFVNFSGLGNTIAVLGLFRAIEDSGASWHFYHNECAGLEDSELVGAVGLTRFHGVFPGRWRRFYEEDWEYILEFMHRRDITHVINLRNEGPHRDRGYAAFKKTSSRFQFFDLDPLYANGSIGSRNLFEQHYELLREAGVEIRPRSGWLDTGTIEHVSSRDEIGLFPAASKSVKAWAEEHWAATARALQHRGYNTVVISGQTPDERAAASRIQCMAGNEVRLLSNLSRFELCRRINACKAIISNDSCAVHIAAAVGTPCVGLYMSTIGRIWGGVAPGNLAVQSQFGEACPEQKQGTGNCVRYENGCEAPCKRDVTVERVLERFEETQIALASAVALRQESAAVCGGS